MPFGEKEMMLLDLCELLGVDMSHFRDPATGVMRNGLLLIIRLQMQKMGIYSMSELARRLHVENVKAMSAKIHSYDRSATKENIEFEKYKSRRSNHSED